MKLPLALLLTLSSAVVSAQSLKIQQLQKAQEGYLSEEVLDMNEACGTEIPVEFDWTSFKPEDFNSEYSIYGYCSASIDTMASMCRESDGLAKKAIATSIKSVICHRGTPRSAKLADGVFHYTLDFKSSNDGAFVREFLGENL